MPTKKHQDRLLPRQLPLLDTQPEYGWLLEKAVDFGLGAGVINFYLNISTGTVRLGESPNYALRFARQQDAEDFASTIAIVEYDGLVAKEHCWY